MPKQRLHLTLPKSERPPLFRTELKVTLSLSLVLGVIGLGAALRGPAPQTDVAALPQVPARPAPETAEPTVATLRAPLAMPAPGDDSAGVSSRAYATFEAPQTPGLDRPSWPSLRPRISLAPPSADPEALSPFAVARSVRPTLRPDAPQATAEVEDPAPVQIAGLARSPLPRLRPAALLARLSADRAVEDALASDVVARRLPAPEALATPELQTVAFTPVPAPTLRGAGASDCSNRLTRDIPRRSPNATSATRLVQQIGGAGGSERDQILTKELLAGNMPGFLRQLTPVAITGDAANGRAVTITICVTPDYLAVGSDADFFRVPLGLPAAALVADRFGFMLPTTRMVDVIYQQAGVRLAPAPMTPGAAMTSTNYFLRHNQTVEGQLRGRTGSLVAGIKKDLVLSERLRRNPGRVAIYGWHRTNGTPIQPLSTVHGAYYADYSHGVRLVSRTAYVDGRAVALADVLSDPNYAGILSKEGPIRSPDRLMAALYR